MSIILTTMCKNQGSRLEEWILYHTNIGIDKFVIFLDNCYDNSKKILEEIITDYNIKIDIYQTEYLMPEYQNVHWIQRSHKMYDYVLIKYTINASWICFVEVDEFILNYKNKIKLNDFLLSLDTKCLYINSWDFKGPFNENKKILGQSNLCWSDEHRFNNGYRWLGKSMIRPNQFNKCIDAYHFQMNDNTVSTQFKKNREYLQVYKGNEVYIDDNIFRIGHFRNHSPPTDINNYINVDYLFKKQIAIIGSGWYGCYVAEYLLDNYNNLSITIIDKNADFYSGSSLRNQNRLHLGFHYPRCDTTKKKCNQYFKRFIDKYDELSEIINKNYYVLSNKSNINFNNYIEKYTELDVESIDNTFLDNIDGKILNVKERFINFNNAKKYFNEKFKNRVVFKLNYEVTTIINKEQSVSINDTLSYDKVFNCTYNQIQSQQNVVYEKCLTLLYKKINPTPFDCLTIMDGDFSSIFFYDNDIYTLTNVKYTPLISSANLNDVIDFKNYDLNDKIKKMEESTLYYYKDFDKNFKYHDYYESFKCKNISTNDSRDINIDINDNIFNVWCGKISFIFEMDKHINKFIV